MLVEETKRARDTFRAWYGSTADFYRFEQYEKRPRKSAPTRDPREALDAWKRAEERGDV